MSATPRYALGWLAPIRTDGRTRKPGAQRDYVDIRAYRFVVPEPCTPVSVLVWGAGPNGVMRLMLDEERVAYGLPTRTFAAHGSLDTVLELAPFVPGRLSRLDEVGALIGCDWPPLTRGSIVLATMNEVVAAIAVIVRLHGLSPSSSQPIHE